MFKEHSSDSPPFHGFQGVSETNSLGVEESSNSLKRVHSNRVTGSEKSKRRNRRPVIGFKIVIDSVSGRRSYQVMSQVQNADSDYMYCLQGKDGNQVTLNLKKINWDLIDRGEKIPLKVTT